ncbi:hypothetical protein AALP_AA8G366400 [Arabis alpina]|uniref:TF-B3 domain-containing protein n=1 Tax=Arabis alpina TaxID=50452 RepID=A0A087GBR2_ARAAL|nr:hypothetical protein AALP_AA8G366400 [Arabis alpina]
MDFDEYGFSPFPDFFRYYNSQEHSQRLVIPSSYKQYYPTPLPQTAVLKKPEGRFWNVKWTITQDDTISFEDGWSKFVKDNGIIEGDFVLFTYDGNRVFWVRVFRGDMVVKPESPVKIQEISDDEDDDTTGGDDDHGVELDSNGNMIISISLGSSDEDYVDEDETTGGGGGDHGVEEDSNENMIISLSLGSSDEDYDDDYVDDDEDTMLCEANSACNGSVMKGGSSQKNCVALVAADAEKYLDEPNNPFFIAKSPSARRVLVINMQVRKDYDLKFGSTINIIDRFGEVKRKIGVWKDRLVINKWDEIYKRNKGKPGDSVVCEILRERGVVHSLKVHFVKK